MPSSSSAAAIPVRFYNRLDGIRGEEAAALFAEDGIWYRDGDESGFTGRAEIAAHVNRLPERGNPNVPPADRIVFHLVTNVEVTVIDAETAEVRALTNVIPAFAEKTARQGRCAASWPCFRRWRFTRKLPAVGRSPARKRNRLYVSVKRWCTAALAALFLCVLLPREAPAQDLPPLKIGVIMSFSGPGSLLGRSVWGSIAAWMAMHHDTLGGRKVELIKRDDAHAPETARRLAQELIVQDKIDLLLGGSSAPEAVAMGEVSTQAKMPYFIINATAPGILAKAPYAMRTSYLTPDFGPPLAAWCLKNGIKTIYAIVADYSSGADTLSSLTDAMAGGKVIGSVAVPLNTTDFSSYLLRAKDSRANAVFGFVGGGPSSINLTKQFTTSGLRAQGMKLIGTADLISDELMSAEGDAALDVVTASNYTVDHDSKLNRAYVSTYRQVIANPTPEDVPSFIAVQAFDALSAMDHAVSVQKGAVDPQKTIDALRGYSFESPRGMISFDPVTREIRESMYIRKAMRTKDGKLVNAEIAAYPPPK